MNIQRFLEGPLSDNNGGSKELRNIVLDQKYIDDDIADDRRSKPTTYSLLRSPDVLFPYQQELKELVLKSYRSGNASAALMSLPTGGGKTRTAIEIFNRLTNDESCRLVWVAPSVELVDQAVSTLKDLWATFSNRKPIHLYHHAIGGDHEDAVVASFLTVQKAVKRTNLLVASNPTLFIFDEAHFAPARSFATVIEHLKNKTDAFILGLSATPGRNDKSESHLRSLFDNQLITPKQMGRSPIEFLRQKQVLAQLEFLKIPLPALWDNFRIKSREQKQPTNEMLACNVARFWATIKTMEELPKTAKCIIFCESIMHANVLAATANWRGLASEVLSYKTPSIQRREILSRFDSGETIFLLNKTLLATGYDNPAITDIIMTMPIRSPILWEQMVGRVSRGPAVGGTAVGKVWEFDHHLEMHESILSYTRYTDRYT